MVHKGASGMTHLASRTVRNKTNCGTISSLRSVSPQQGAWIMAVPDYNVAFVLAEISEKTRRFFERSSQYEQYNKRETFSA